MDLKIVKNSKKYYEFIRELRNNESLKVGFINQENVTKEQQEQYMKKYKNCYYICLCNNVPSGFIGVIEKDIRVATHPDYQKKGIALFLVNEIKKIYKNEVQAKIKVDNEASLKLFKKAGFNLRYYLLEP
jgi:ribosomal protein S18 acetylase RimI-like enzyme